MKQNKRISNSASNNKDPNDQDDPYRSRSTLNLLANLRSHSRESAAQSGLSFTPEGSLDDDALRTLLPDNNQLQTNKSRPAVVAIPKRFGVQDYTAQAPEGSSILLDRGVQTASKYCNSFNDVSVQFSPDLHVSSAYGRPVLPRANNGGPLTENGPPQSSVPIQNWRPMPTTSTGVGLPVAEVDEDPQNCEAFYRPYPKRAAIRSPPDATRVHRRKLTEKPTSPSITENGPPQSSVPIQNWRPMPTTSTGVGLPVAEVDEDPQNCEAFYRPYPKRAAIRSPPDATRVHRRKLTEKPTSPSITENGPPQSSVPIQNWRPMPTTSTGVGLPVAKVDEDPQNGEAFYRPYPKRGAIRSPPDATRVHRRKLTEKPTSPSITENGPPQSSVPIQNWRPMPTTSTGVGFPVAKVDEDPQNGEAFYRPYPKRGAIRSPPDATRVHRRKLTEKPTSPSISNRPIPPSMPYKPVPPSVSCKPVPPPSFKPKNAPAFLPTPNTAHSSTPALSHIKWQGNNEPPEPNGDKCLICRRDLIFSPEGPVERPPISPPVAVLHCGHTFHDHCLQKITPEEQSKSPPCIPCAMGDI